MWTPSRPSFGKQDGRAWTLSREPWRLREPLESFDLISLCELYGFQSIISFDKITYFWHLDVTWNNPKPFSRSNTQNRVKNQTWTDLYAKSYFQLHNDNTINLILYQHMILIKFKSFKFRMILSQVHTRKWTQNQTMYQICIIHPQYAMKDVELLFGGGWVFHSYLNGTQNYVSVLQVVRGQLSMDDPRSTFWVTNSLVAVVTERNYVPHMVEINLLLGFLELES